MAKCAMCGRPTTPYAYIGAEAIGPKCARRAGLVKGKTAKGSRIRFADPGPKTPRERIPVTMDLFDNLEPFDPESGPEGGEK